MMSEPYEPYEDSSDCMDSSLPGWLTNTAPMPSGTYRGTDYQMKVAERIAETPATERLHIPYDAALRFLWDTDAF